MSALSAPPDAPRPSAAPGTPLSLPAPGGRRAPTRRAGPHPALVRLFRFGFVALVYVFVASTTLVTQMRGYAFRGNLPHMSLERMLAGTAHRPYAFRVLSPFVVRSAAEAVAPRLPDRAMRYLETGSPLVRYKRPSEPWGPAIALHFHLAYAWVFLCLLGAVVAGRFLLRCAGWRPGAFVDFAPAVAMLLLPLAFVSGVYFYDAAELLLLLLATALLLRRQWVGYYACFALAVLNKESDVLLGLSFLAIAAPGMPRRPLVGHLGLHAVLGGALLVATRWAFRHNPGEGAGFQLWENLAFWADPRSYLLVFSGPAPLIPVPRGANVLNLALAGFGVFAWWGEKPGWLRRLLLLVALVNFPLLLLFCFRDELRNLSLLFPGLFLAFCWTVARVYRAEEAAEG